VEIRSDEVPDYSIPEEMLFPKEYKKEEEEDDKKKKAKICLFRRKKEKKEEFKPLFDAFTIKTALVSEIRMEKFTCFCRPWK
jgi:hypothetical protein